MAADSLMHAKDASRDTTRVAHWETVVHPVLPEVLLVEEQFPEAWVVVLLVEEVAVLEAVLLEAVLLEAVLLEAVEVEVEVEAVEVEVPEAIFEAAQGSA